MDANRIYAISDSQISFEKDAAGNFHTYIHLRFYDGSNIDIPLHNGGWIDAEKQLPPENTIVIVAIEGWNYPDFAVYRNGKWRAAYFEHLPSLQTMHLNVKYWMLAPEVPLEVKKPEKEPNNHEEPEKEPNNHEGEVEKTKTTENYQNKNCDESNGSKEGETDGF